MRHNGTSQGPGPQPGYRGLRYMDTSSLTLLPVLLLVVLYNHLVHSVQLTTELLVLSSVADLLKTLDSKPPGYQYCRLPAMTT